MDFMVCDLGRNEKGEVVPGKRLGNYESDTMLAPGMTITFDNKKILIKSIETRENGDKLLLTEPFKRNK
jgi:hypothetical protein